MFCNTPSYLYVRQCWAFVTVLCPEWRAREGQASSYALRKGQKSCRAHTHTHTHAIITTTGRKNICLKTLLFFKNDCFMTKNANWVMFSSFQLQLSQEWKQTKLVICGMWMAGSTIRCKNYYAPACECCFLELSKLANFYDRAVEANNSWIYNHHRTHHICTIVDEAVDGCHTKSLSRTLMWIVFISNRSRIIRVWKYHTVGMTVLRCRIRVALWLWTVSHTNLKEQWVRPERSKLKQVPCRLQGTLNLHKHETTAALYLDNDKQQDLHCKLISCL